PFEVVTLATSLGGLYALRQVLSGLPERFPAPILVVQHLSAVYPSHLVELLEGYTRLGVQWARHGEYARPGQISLAPSKHHLLLSAHHTLRLSEAPPVHYSRPAADPLFQSAAAHCRERTLGVVLTGGGCDGARGALAIKLCGGRVLVQEPAHA